MRWTEEKANEWYKKAGRVIGCNYFPATSVNSTEMWQKETYDPETIKRELSLAASVGYNSIRVLIQFLVWEAERDSFIAEFDDFLGIAAANGISVMPILFEDCAFSGLEPYLGKQNPPTPGVHNSGCTPSPGETIADDPSRQEDLRRYVTDVIGTFKNDKRILVWDLYNEPGNNQRGEKSLPLVRNAFKWARETEPSQPLTVGIWSYDADNECVKYQQEYAELSDVISYHDYASIEKSKQVLSLLKKYNRPLFCTEWLCRQAGSTFESHFPFFMEENVGVYNWGLVVGKTQTNLHWSTMPKNENKPDPNPRIWQHDIFYNDFTPYKETEVEILRKYSICTD